MKTSPKYKAIEFYLLFVVIPLSYALSYPIVLKVGIGVLGFIYVIFMLVKVEQVSFKLKKELPWATFWRSTLLKLCVIALLTSAFVYLTNRAALFQVVLEQPLKWLTLLFIYSFFSVYPQEVLYRTFFFKRYTTLFTSSYLLVFINAIVFALGHFFFGSTLVLVITFVGGLLFGSTYLSTKSTFLVAVEHAIYGSWLFTVGMGQMLGFPV